MKENTVGKLFKIFEKKVKLNAGTVEYENVAPNNCKTVGNIEQQVNVAIDVEMVVENTVDRVNVTRGTEMKFDQKNEEIEEEPKPSDPVQQGAELAAGEPLDRPEVWPDLGKESHHSITETKTEISCDSTATLPSTSNLGFGISTARGQHKLDNLWDGIGKDRDWTELSESEGGGGVVD